MRLAFGSRAHVLESLLAAAAHRQDVVAPGEDIDFADPQLAVNLFDHVRDGEQRVTVFLELRPLMALACVFDGERMQVEFALHLIQRLLIRLEQGDPDEAVGLVDVEMDVADVDVGMLSAVLVEDTADQHAKPPSLVLQLSLTQAAVTIKTRETKN